MPLARTTSRMFLSVAPSEPSRPSARIRRCARTVKPPTPTRAISSIPTVARASRMVCGLIEFSWLKVKISLAVSVVLLKV